MIKRIIDYFTYKNLRCLFIGHNYYDKEISKNTHTHNFCNRCEFFIRIK